MKIFLLFFLLSSLSWATDFAYFTPPGDWLIADPSTYAPSVSICFIHKKKGPTPPSINLAIEENVPSLNEYAQAVRAIHESNPKNRWRKLMSLPTQGPTGLLTEIDTDKGGKPMRLLQLLIVHNNTAYTLTAAALSAEMNQHYDAFLKTFKSFTITQNLLDSIADNNRREALKDRLKHLKTEDDVKSFQNEFADMGQHWQLLVLRNAQRKPT